MALPRLRSRALAATVAALACSLTACGGTAEDRPSTASPGTQPTVSATSSPTVPSPTATPSPTRVRPTAPPSDRPVIGATPPRWLGQRVLPLAANGLGQVRPTPAELERRRFTLPDRLPPLPGNGFASRVTTPAPAAVLARSTWKQGCPVGPQDLAWVRLTFAGFDGRRHTGELLVNRSVAGDLVSVFRTLYDQRFPLEELRITRADELDAPPTGDGNDTGVFACRPTTGGSSYSQHAYGLAIDVNPFQNPYEKGDVVLPELASSYLDRGRVRPGMITADGPVVRAFAGIGWEWGGAWNSLKDYQHFSQNGR
jgi:hypothetical protein